MSKAEQMNYMFDKGLSAREVSRQLDIDLRWAQRKHRIWAGEKGRDYAARGANDRPPIAPVPDGFHLSSLSTTVDANGKARSQSFRAKSGYEGDVVPETGAFDAPEGMFVRSVSTLVDGQTGAVKQQWVKADLIKEAQLNAIQIACKAVIADMPPLPEVPAPEHTQADLCNLYTMTDCHVGMLAWGRETGEPWDLNIAEATLLDVFSRMVLAAPPARVGVINQLGDFLHFDSLKPLTPEHANVVDADSRYQKIVEVAVKILRRLVDIALMRHEIVIVKMAEGNHDPAGSVWLRVMFAQLYADNPRVVVEQSPLPYTIYQHGKTLLGFHHGHLTSKESLPLIFAAKFREMWGQCKSVYIHTGHKHNSEEREHPGVKVIQHPTLAAPDAYAARGGWLSKRQATAITYHTEFGEYCRHTVLPQED
jgi:hypothetical protein